jgi:hypothetical protein
LSRAKYKGDAAGHVDEDTFDMAKLAWKEDYLQGNEVPDGEIQRPKTMNPNACVLVYGQCSPEQRQSQSSRS